MKFYLFLVLMIMPVLGKAQSDLENVLKGGELLLSGLSILKVSKSDGKQTAK
jgi:hypothetical protein